ncbi:MAG TPA: orotidine-5'-phosphate decarboxylase [Ferruginibacter sp.]|nr:orotidine-5'-phosphate decarboxylase [Ferruginibacter sp.]HMP21610.1 orotidine-5'-phosphate decarboxylase [Ferruginibacter sp.]
MTRAALLRQIQQKQSYLCIGLDTDIGKIPQHLQQHPNAVFEFNKAIIDATKDICVSYKINTAFYEAMGAKGWEVMEQTLNYIPEEHFTIADAKRGDIGNTSAQYAKAFFETLNFDAITIAPYMGEDSVRPFLEIEGKWAIVLGLTSNSGSKDFEQQQVLQQQGSSMLYEVVLEKVAQWGTTDNLMFVTGATKATDFATIRKIIPHHFLLVPGVGTQGGSLKEVTQYGMNKDCGLLVNVSRAVIYAGSGEDFALKARGAAIAYADEMGLYLKP